MLDPLYCLLNLFEQTNDGMVAFRIGELYQKLGEIEKAIQYYEIAYELFPKREFKEWARDRIESLISSDWITINRKLIPECLQSDNPINRLKRLYEQTGDGMVAFKLGELLESKGDFDEALKFYEIAHNRFPLPLWIKKAEERIRQIKERMKSQEVNEKVLFIVSCTRSKIWDNGESRKLVPAKEAYTGFTMRVWLMLEESKRSPWVIFSSKYGFIDPNQLIENYNIHFVKNRNQAVSEKTLKEQIKNNEFKYRGSKFRISDFDEVYFIGSREYYDELKQTFDKIGLRFKRYPKRIALEKWKTNAEKILELINYASEFLALLEKPQRLTSAKIPDDSGIYAIIHRGDVIYIGSSNNLKRRILDNHLNGSKDVSILRAKLCNRLRSEYEVTKFLEDCNVVFMTVHDNLKKALEHYLIALLEPAYN